MSNFSEITYSAKQVVCEHPRLIINPLLPELVAKYRNYVIRGQFYRVTKCHVHYYNFDYRPFSIKRHNITVDDVETSFVVDYSTGETFPIYCLVPCNGCSVCKQRKISSFVQRCKMETMQYDCRPWFVTLTYDNDNLPSCGVDVRDVQLFLKRLRINLFRHGYSSPIRFVCVGEYGKRTHRSHYHLIIWNIQSFTHKQLLDVADLIRHSWNKGFIQHRLVDPSNDKAFYYTAKYLKKECVVPKGCNPTFMTSSVGHGGIGSRFLDKCSTELRKTLNINFKFLNKWTGKTEDMVFSSYVLNRVFPSFHKSVPSALRRDLQDYSLAYTMYERFNSDLFSNQFKKQYERFYDKFSCHTFFCKVLYFEVPRELRPTNLVEELTQLGQRIEKYMSLDLEEAEKISQKRDRFIFKLFEFLQPIDVGARAHQARRNFNFTSAWEVL